MAVLFVQSVSRGTRILTHGKNDIDKEICAVFYKKLIAVSNG